MEANLLSLNILSFSSVMVYSLFNATQKTLKLSGLKWPPTIYLLWFLGVRDLGRARLGDCGSVSHEVAGV